MKAQIVGQVELFSGAELASLKFVPEELEAIEEELVPDLDNIPLEEVAKELEAYFEGGVEQAGLEGKGKGRGGHGSHKETKVTIAGVEFRGFHDPKKTILKELQKRGVDFKGIENPNIEVESKQIVLKAQNGGGQVITNINYLDFLYEIGLIQRGESPKPQPDRGGFGNSGHGGAGG